MDVGMERAQKQGMIQNARRDICHLTIGIRQKLCSQKWYDRHVKVHVATGISHVSEQAIPSQVHITRAYIFLNTNKPMSSNETLQISK